MSLRDVVRQDLHTAFRLRVAVNTLLFVAGVTALPAYFALRRLARPRPTLLDQVYTAATGQRVLVPEADLLVVVVATSVGLVLPLSAVSVSSDSILVERERRTIKLLLGLPNSRADVLLGKVVARSLFVLVPLALGFAAVGAAGAAFGSGLPLRTLLGLAALSALLVVCFVGVGTAISTVASTSRRATVLAFGVFVATSVFWRLGQFLLYFRRTERVFPPGRYYPEWFYATDRLSPVWAFEAASQGLLSEGTVHPFVADAPPGSIYANAWLPVGVMLGWLALALLVGYVAFDRADLG